MQALLAGLPSNGWRCHGTAKRACNGVAGLRVSSAIVGDHRLVKVSAVLASGPRAAQRAVQHSTSCADGARHTWRGMTLTSVTARPDWASGYFAVAGAVFTIEPSALMVTLTCPPLAAREIEEFMTTTRVRWRRRKSPQPSFTSERYSPHPHHQLVGAI
jgi:hypothetical protein